MQACRTQSLQSALAKHVYIFSHSLFMGSVNNFPFWGKVWEYRLMRYFSATYWRQQYIDKAMASIIRNILNMTITSVSAWVVTSTFLAECLAFFVAEAISREQRTHRNDPYFPWITFEIFFLVFLNAAFSLIDFVTWMMLKKCHEKTLLWMDFKIKQFNAYEKLLTSKSVQSSRNSFS